LLHPFEPADHGFDAAANLLVLLQQRGTLRRQRILTLPQRSIFFLQLSANDDELFETFFEAPQLEIETMISFNGRHAPQYRTALIEGQQTLT
jgi:hypothetical protein